MKDGVEQSPPAAEAPTRLMYLAHMRVPSPRAHTHQIMQMCEALADEGCEVTLLCGRIGRGGSQAPDPWEAYGVKRNFALEPMPSLDLAALSRRLPRSLRPVVLGLLWAQSLLVYSLAIALRLRREDRAIVYSRDALPLWILARLWPGRAERLVFEAHTCPSRWPGKNLRRDLARRIGAMVVVTRNLQRRLHERGISPRRVLVAHDGVRLARFALDGDRRAWRAKLDWPTEAFIVGYAGRLETLDMDKGVAFLASAVAELATDPGRRWAHLALVGPSERELESLRSGSPAGMFLSLGWIHPARLPGILRAMDVCAIPFPWTEHLAYDASPLKLFEYMASGTPIVASDLPAIAEVLRHEWNALMVPPGDLQAWGQALRRLRDEPGLGDRLARQAAFDVREFSWDIRARRVVELLHAAEG